MSVCVSGLDFPAINARALGENLLRLLTQGHSVYFAAAPAVATGQKAARCAAQPQTPLPSAAEAIAILVLAIQHPRGSPQELCARLRPTHPQLTPATISALFAHHGLTLKKTPPSPGSMA